MPAQQGDQADTVAATRGSAASKSLAALVGGAKNVTCPSGAAAAMARTNGNAR
jgi:hypothetical protein